MTYPEQVREILWKEISTISQSASNYAVNPESDFTRNRKLNLETLMRFLISMQSGTTAHELLKFFDYSTDTITNSGFVQQREKLLPKAFQQLLYQFNSNFTFSAHSNKYRLLAVDGTEFNIARNTDDPETYHPPTGRALNGFNSVYVTALFDLLNKTYLDCVIQPGKSKNEFRAICDLAQRYQSGDTPVFIGDRGTPSYNFFANAAKNNIFYLIRTKDINAKRLLGLSQLPKFIDSNIDLIITRSNSKKKRLHPHLEHQYRFIDKNVAFDFIEHGSRYEYHLSLRVVRLEVNDGVFVSLVTNLPADSVQASVLKEWYSLRWGIETSFRELKHTIGALNFISKKAEFIKQEIWARLTLFNFCALITAHVAIDKVDSKHVYQICCATAFKICIQFINRKERDPPIDVMALIGRYTLPIRPHRRFERHHRFQLPSRFCYRHA
jgi:hypothetical protein